MCEWMDSVTTGEQLYIEVNCRVDDVVIIIINNLPSRSRKGRNAAVRDRQTDSAVNCPDTHAH